MATGAEVLARRYLYDDWDLVAEFNAPGGTTCGALVRSYTWGLDIASSLSATGGVGALIQVADHANNKVFFPTYDGNGNITSLVNGETGVLAAVYEYGPFGENLRSEVRDVHVADQPFRFSTKFVDGETGLAYYGARFYAPDLGRFINRDPIEEEGGLNLYGFCGNDGINAIDYLGQKSLFSRFWTKFRHTVISAALYAVPGFGPGLATMYNVSVGGRYGGIRGALTAFAASQIGGSFFSGVGGSAFGNSVMWGARLYGLGRTFARGKFLTNLGNFAAHLGVGALGNAAASSLFKAVGLSPDQATDDAKDAAAAADDAYHDAAAPEAGKGLPSHVERIKDTRSEGFSEVFDDNKASGFYAALYKNSKSGVYMVAFRGTEGWKDVLADIAQGLGIPTKQYRLAIRLASNAARIYGDRVLLVGHSLGGGLAAAASMVTGQRSFVYNAAGVHPFTVGIGKSITYDRRLIQHYHLSTDILTFAQSALPVMPGNPGALFRINPARVGLLFNPLASHSMDNTILGLSRGAMGAGGP